jgi:hypothetical protein
MNGYFLEGVSGEHILVFRTENHEDLLRIIKKLQTSRDRETKTLARKLEIEWHDRHK